jgi:hypothetical protein
MKRLRVRPAVALGSLPSSVAVPLLPDASIIDISTPRDAALVERCGAVNGRAEAIDRCGIPGDGGGILHVAAGELS